MLDKLLVIEEKYEELTAALSNPNVLSNAQAYQKCSKEQAELMPIVEKIKEYKKLLADLEDAEEILKAGDGDLRELAQE
jgi:peptide chain release factor 1